MTALKNFEWNQTSLFLSHLNFAPTLSGHDQQKMNLSG